MMKVVSLDKITQMYRIILMVLWIPWSPFTGPLHNLKPQIINLYSKKYLWKIICSPGKYMIWYLEIIYNNTCNLLRNDLPTNV